MSEEELYIKNKGLIYMAIKQKHLYWNTDDEFQQYYDAGEEGLIKGIKTYDSTKGYKISTYLYTCICNEIHKYIQINNLPKRKNRFGKDISLNKLVVNENESLSELIDFIPSDVNIEEEIEKKIRHENLLKYVNNLKNERDKEVIKHFYGLEGRKSKSTREIARDWGVSQNAINSRRIRALNTLKKVYGKQLI